MTGSAAPILGIDLGTTHSLVAVVRDGRPEVLVSREGKRLVPSVISFEQGEAQVGYSAKARRRTDAARTVYSVKRLLGRAYGDVVAQAGDLPYRLVAGAQEVRVEIEGRSYSPVELSSMILRELKESAESALGQPVSRAVITVPAYFNDSQRQATRMAGKLAGLEVLRIVNEPTAAALAFGLGRKGEGLVAVYDLGGGTFDVSILKIDRGVFDVLATAGDTHLGGDDLDLAIARWAAPKIVDRLGLDPFADERSKGELLDGSERAKIALSDSEKASVELDFGASGTFRLSLTRAELAELARPVLERTRAACLQALADAGVSASELTDVVLVGGPTRLEAVRERVRSIFGREPDGSMHPDEVVALGAAIQADILGGGNRDLLLLDVVPLSLGIETYGGLMSTLIPRNTKVPATAREVFTTYVDRQTGVDIHVLQGEREKVEENRSLARFKLTGLEPMPAGFPRIEVLFLIDADGILQVTARDLKTGAENTVEVRPSYGIAPEEVERILADASSHSGEDRVFRRLVDARTDAEPVLRACEKNLDAARRLLEASELERLERCLRDLRSALQGTDVDAVHRAHRELERASQPLADRLVGDALTRKPEPK